MGDVVWGIQAYRNFREAQKKASEVPNDQKTEEVKGATTPTMATGTLSATTKTTAKTSTETATETTSTTATTETPEPREDF